MLKRLDHRATLFACFSGYVTQAVVVNFFPLLFLTFCEDYGISIAKVTVLVTVNFGVQLITDMLSGKLIGKIGHRVGMVLANASALLGFVLLCFLPDIIDPYLALILCVIFCAVGSGLEEVLISPIVEACPTKKKSAIMSLAHSFYCWGTVLVIGVSTLFFVTVGIDKWRILSLVWGIIPLFNLLCFTVVPVFNKKEMEETVSKENGGLFKNKILWLFGLLMICAGASEQAMQQWASAFAEDALKVDKTIGDLLGPMMFALMMGISRTVYAAFSSKIKLKAFMLFSSALCVTTFLVAVFSPISWLALVACGLCGFSVGIMWPGTLSLAAGKIRGGATKMFVFLALCGDIGCTSGPTLVGLASGVVGGLKGGLLLGAIFPLVLFVAVLSLKKNKKKEEKQA